MPVEKPFRKLITPLPREILSDFDEQDFLITANNDLELKNKFYFGWDKLPILDQKNTDYCTAFGGFRNWMLKLSGKSRQEVFEEFTNENAFFIAKTQFSDVISEVLRKILPTSITKFQGRNIKAALWNLNHGIALPSGDKLFIDAYFRVDFKTGSTNPRPRFEEICRILQDRGVLMGGLTLKGDWTIWFNAKGEYTGKGVTSGAHLITLTGFDLEKKVIYFDNSWGKSWGDLGRGTIPMEKVRDLIEIWAIGRSYFQISEEEMKQIVAEKREEISKNMKV